MARIIGNNWQPYARSPIATLPDEVLLLIFADVQADGFRRHRGVSSVSPYKDLLACNTVCRYWTLLVPKILYRDVRVSNHNGVCSVSWGGPSVLGLLHAALLSNALDRNLRNSVTVLTLDVVYVTRHSVAYAFSIFELCPHLRAIALHVNGGDGLTDPVLRYSPAPGLSELKRLTHLRLSGVACDLGPLLIGLLGVWPRLTYLDVLDCGTLSLPDNARIVQVPRLQHLRTRSAHVAVARLLEDQPDLRAAAWKVTSPAVNVREVTRGMELLFLHVRTLHLAFGSTATIANAEVAAVLCQLSSLRTLIFWTAMSWNADDLAGTIPQCVQEIGIFFTADVQTDAFRWHRGSSSLSPYKDLLACSAVCRYWAHLVPKILYRDVRLANHNWISLVSWGGLSVLEYFHASLLSDALDRDLRNFVTVLTLDVLFDMHPGTQYAFSIFELCQHLRAIALHVHRSGGTVGPGLQYNAVTGLSDLKRLTHFRLSGEGCDVGRLLLDILGDCPQITHLDVIDCEILVLPSDARLEQMPRLQHLRARSAHAGLARLLAPGVESQPELRTAVWKVSSAMNFHPAARGTELLFLRVRTLHLVFGSSETIASGEVAAVLCQLSSLRTLVLRTALKWNADDLVRAIPQWVEEIGIVFTAGLCVPPEVLAQVLRRSLRTWWSAQTAYCDKLTQLCECPVEERSQSELDFLNLRL
ncbi:hypothetical protein AURDEDRAFT_155932 [Auricularia subglabra TFB-10046 SS5]|nr:hypothetical protein AURDEDRAFT_155932 [Auricularia subglabra TFB-10046 SS5]